jgi:hypothetical protein
MRRASMRLIDYQSLFHSELDGVWTGPFFPLCPLGYMRVVATGVNPARAAGLIPPQKEVSLAPDFVGAWDREQGRKVTYLNHLYWAETLSGTLRTRGTLNPDAGDSESGPGTGSTSWRPARRHFWPRERQSLADSDGAGSRKARAGSCRSLSV